MFFVLLVWDLSQKGVLSPIISKDFGPEMSYQFISMGIVPERSSVSNQYGRCPRKEFCLHQYGCCPRKEFRLQSVWAMSQKGVLSPISMGVVSERSSVSISIDISRNGFYIH